MNRRPPDYFEPIRQAAERRWQQLEADPELAGPWHQLFKQVQSPRHVLSELLQNADDAGATEASARVISGVFEFTHNGEDFQPDHFASLCRFGYSNKRSLHTIGFRGIGFKSTFSLGPVVEIRTPSLSIFFEKDRFTLPCWYDASTTDSHTTCILVKIQDERKQAELAKNLAEWKKSPVSLLFFKTIRRLTLDGDQLFWHSKGAGPIQSSEWYALNDTESEKFLLARSEPEDFPPACVDEIKQERILGGDSDFSLPPSRVELVLGASAGIYVVLPTSVRPNLPFACNGPFMQDPARVKIKDPETSPTNRWLLARLGKLAASCMSDWLANHALDMASRAEAYKLLPKTGTSSSRSSFSAGFSGQWGIEDECVEEVSRSFFEHTEHQHIVLAYDGSMEARGSCIALDKQIQNIWDSKTFSESLDPDGRKLISSDIPGEAIELLIRRGQIEKLNRAQICSFLHHANPPNPGLERLLQLWIYISGELAKLGTSISLEDLAIVPIGDQALLFPARSAVRLGTSKAQLNEDDLHWLATHVLFVDREWLIYLADEDTDYVLQRGRYGSIWAKEVALSLLQQMGLADGADTTKLVERITTSLSRSSTLDTSTCVRLAHICARLDCRVPKNFPYVTQSGTIRYIAKGVGSDSTKTIQALLPSAYANSYFIADTYWNSPLSCSLDEWESWIATAKPGLKSLPPLEETTHQFRHAKELVDHLQASYGESLDLNLLPYKWERYSSTQRYNLIDRDFDQQIILHWAQQQSSDLALSTLARYILESSSQDWFLHQWIEVYQTNHKGLGETRVEGHGIYASWLRRFRNSACIPDTRGTLCKPGELLRRSEETEPLIGIERFIGKRFDNEANELILDSLGVSAALPGPHLILSLLRTLTAIDCPPKPEAIRLYEQLDKIYQLSKQEDQFLVLDAFKSDNLILTEQGRWASPRHVFIYADGLEASGISTLIDSVRHLSLWRQIGLRERPDAESAVAMVQAAPLDTDLSAETFDLLQVLLRRFSDSVIDQCGVWLSLSKQLRSLKELPYGLSDADFDTNYLFSDTLNRCADLRFMDGYSLELVLRQGPIQEITEILSYQLIEAHVPTKKSNAKPQWLQTFGQCVSRLKLESPNNSRLFDSGSVLAKAPIYFWDDLRVTPMLDGKPIGRPIEKDGALISGAVYVKSLPGSRLANLIPVIIGEYLQSAELQAAAAYCFDRSDELILDYFMVNYGVNVEDSDLPLVTASPQQTQSSEHIVFSPKQKEGNVSRGAIDHDNPMNPFGGLPNSADNESLQMAPGPLTPKAPDLVSLDDSAVIFIGDRRSDPLMTGPDVDPLDKSTNQTRLNQADLATVASTSVGSDLGSSGSVKAKPDAFVDAGFSAQYALMVEYAQSLGLHEISDGLFRSDDQRTLRRQRGELFPWVLEASSGLEVKRFLVRTTPILASPLELDAIAFGLLEQLPDAHSILLPDTSGKAGEMSGIQLKAMITNGRVKVFPSSYRLAIA